MPALVVPPTGLALEGPRASPGPDIFALTLKDGVIEEMIKCYNSGKLLQISLGERPVSPPHFILRYRRRPVYRMLLFVLCCYCGCWRLVIIAPISSESVIGTTAHCTLLTSYVALRVCNMELKHNISLLRSNNLRKISFDPQILILKPTFPHRAPQLTPTRCRKTYLSRGQSQVSTGSAKLIWLTLRLLRRN